MRLVDISDPEALTPLPHYRWRQVRSSFDGGPVVMSFNGYGLSPSLYVLEQAYRVQGKMDPTWLELELVPL